MTRAVIRYKKGGTLNISIQGKSIGFVN